MRESRSTSRIRHTETDILNTNCSKSAVERVNYQVEKYMFKVNNKSNTTISVNVGLTLYLLTWSRYFVTDYTLEPVSN